MANAIELKVKPEQLQLIGGGATREATDFNSGEKQLRNGKQVRRMPGVTALLDGVPLDGFTVETTAEVETLGDGVVLSASGEVTLRIRADARAGFNGGSPRGMLAGKVYVENLVPIGDLASLVAQAARRSGKAAE